MHSLLSGWPHPSYPQSFRLNQQWGQAQEYEQDEMNINGSMYGIESAASDGSSTTLSMTSESSGDDRSVPDEDTQEGREEEYTRNFVKVHESGDREVDYACRRRRNHSLWAILLLGFCLVGFLVATGGITGKRTTEQDETTSSQSRNNLNNNRDKKKNSSSRDRHQEGTSQPTMTSRFPAPGPKLLSQPNDHISATASPDPRQTRMGAPFRTAPVDGSKTAVPTTSSTRDETGMTSAPSDETVAMSIQNDQITINASPDPRDTQKEAPSRSASFDGSKTAVPMTSSTRAEAGSPPLVATFAPNGETVAASVRSALLELWPPGGRSLDDPTSYQSRALAWLQDHPGFPDDDGEWEVLQHRHQKRSPDPPFSNGKEIYGKNIYKKSHNSGGHQRRRLSGVDRILQRFALACIYYATSAVETPATDLVFVSGVSDEHPNYKLPSWTNRAGWLDYKGRGETDKVVSLSRSAEKGECTWHGVTCDSSGRVVDLDLSHNQLTGSFPGEVVLLKNSLEVLNLSHNILFNEGDDGHAWLGELKRLRILFIGNNYFANHGIPNVIGRLTNLVDLDCSYTLYYGPLNADVFQNLTQLEYLSIGGNSYNSPIPKTLFRYLPNLVFLYAEFSDLTGNLDFLLGLENLAEFWVDMNPGLAGSRIPPALGWSATSLSSFSVTSCGLTGPLPPSMGRLTNMREMWLYDNRLKGVIPASFGALTKLSRLELEMNDLIGVMPGALCASSGSGDNSGGSLSILEADCDGKITCQADCCTCCGPSCANRTR